MFLVYIYWFCFCPVCSCVCADAIDKAWGHVPRNDILSHCEVFNLEGFCICSMESRIASAIYTGYMPIPMPIFLARYNKWFSNNKSQEFPPADIPNVTSFGGWYSHPMEGKCIHSTPVGDGGCTWSRDPRARVLFPPELQSRGWIGRPLNSVLQSDAIHNAAVAKAAFNDAFPLESRCCGC